MDDAASDTTHESLADSSYDIVSEADSAFDDVSSSSVPSRAATPTHDSEDEAKDEAQDEAQDEAEPPQQALEHTTSEGLVEKSIDSKDDPGETPKASVKFDKAPWAIPRVIYYQLASTKLSLHRPFRITYHGTAEHKDAIVEKIAQALSLSSSSDNIHTTSSRFNVVQLSSFGEEEPSPEVTLIPFSGAELVVDTCSSCATFAGKDFFRPIVHEDEDRDIYYMHRFEHREGKRDASADLAIYVHERTCNFYTSLINSRNAARSGLPTLDIADRLLQGCSPREFQAGALRISMKMKGYRPEAFGTPIDLASFLDLDASLLNRNIAYVTQTRFQRLYQHTRGYLAGCGKKLRETLEPYKCTAKEICEPIMARDFDLPKISLVVLLLLLSLFAGNLMNGYLQRPLTIDPGVRPGCQRLQPTGACSKTQAVPTNAVAWKDRDAASWPKLWDSPPGLAPPKPFHNTISGSNVPQGNAATDPTVELVPVRGFLYYLRLPPDSIHGTRSPQPKVIATSVGKPVDISIAKWNATLYSLDFQPEDKSKAIEVSVGFERSPRVYIFRIEPQSMWVDFATIQGLFDRKRIGSGVAACVATSKELSKVAQREIAVFRDQTNGLIIGSADRLQSQAKSMRQTSSSTAVTVWNRLSDRQAILATGFWNSSKNMTKELQVQAQHLTTALSKNVVSLRAARSNLQEKLQKGLVKAKHEVSEHVVKLGEGIGQFDRGAGVISKARTRAKALRRKMKRGRTPRTDCRAAFNEAGSGRKADRRAKKAKHA